MRSTAFAIALFLALTVSAAPAAAQYGVGGSDRATGETYHVEVGGCLWYPSPTIFISSESLGIIGSTIDFVEDLGIDNQTFTQLKVVLRPAVKHKFRFEYTPIGYEAESTLRRSIIFNGQRFDIALPVDSELNWKAYRLRLRMGLRLS